MVGEVLLFRVGLSNTERLYAKVDPGILKERSLLFVCVRARQFDIRPEILIFLAQSNFVHDVIDSFVETINDDFEVRQDRFSPTSCPLEESARTFRRNL